MLLYDYSRIDLPFLLLMDIYVVSNFFAITSNASMNILILYIRHMVDAPVPAIFNCSPKSLDQFTFLPAVYERVSDSTSLQQLKSLILLMLPVSLVLNDTSL